MKRILSTILLCVTVLCAYSQEDITLFFLNDGTFKGFYDEEIDSITYSHLDLDSIWHTDAVVQEVWLADSVVRIPVEKIDSICHRVPDPVYRPGVVKIDERYLPYITSVEGLTITFSSGLPENLWPKEGSVLLYEGSNNIFPNGFAGTVTKLVDGVAVCDSAAVDDVYERLYFFGSYVLAEDGEGTGTYSAKKIRSRHADDKEDDWGIFEVDPTNIPFDKIKIAEKIDISRANMFVAISGTITPTVTVEAAYVFNVYEPLIFFKATHRFEYDALLQVGFNKDFTPKHHKDIGKPFRMHKLDENRDEKGFHLYFINESVPIPQCPVLTAGFKMGLFIDPKIEAEVVLGLHIQASEDKTHIYRLDKNNIGRLGEWWKGNGPEPETSSCEIELDGSLTGSVWAGLMAAINVGVGTDKCGMKEELSARIGPYIEGKLNLDFMDLNKDMSWYSGLKDSKIKRGIKSAFNLDFTAKMPKVFSYKWTQLELSPPKLFFEQDCYLLPAFEAPTYSVQGNSLKCYTSVTRSTVPNHIGLRVKDESGKEVTKWQNFTFDFADKDNPYVISETFDNLDFANHRYTIIPVTRIWELPALEIPEPSQTCVTCPDSRHPHLIDLGLPSGTKWLCQNVYADDPKDAGGYYQWGKPFMVHAYTDLTYRAPSSAMANYQSSEHDAATANLGQEYCTPTMSQFNELHDNCSMDYKYSPWGNNVLGVFLKGKNGNNLYLPFSGFKSGVKVNNKSEGCFLSSDAVDSDNNLQRKAVVIKNNDAIWHSTDALAYGYSVRPVSAGSDGLVIEPQQLDYEVIVGQKVGQSVTVTNNGSSPVSVTVVQTTAPFQVDDAGLGTFTVKPKGQHSVLVYFSPTEEKEYVSVLTLSYEKGNTRVVSKVSLKGKGVNSSNIPLKLSATSISLTAGQQGTVNITSGSGSYAAVSNATNVATVTVEGSKLIIKAVAKGTATITVKDNQTQERAKIEVTVKASEVITPGTAIDLGLPSGTLWASCNVGATKPEDFGNYYAWGETEEKDYYYWDNYMCEESECGTTKDPVYTWNGNKLYADIAGSKFDVATSKWGSSWHMPSSTQMDELLNECIWTWCDGDKTKYNGTNVKGYIISSKVNNNKIFLPAAGNYHKDEILYKNESCLYWSSSQFDGSPFEGEANYTNSNSAMGMDYNNKATYTDLRYYGQTIRPVMNAQQPTVQTETITIPGTNVSFKMIGVEGGTFWMGSADDDSNAEEDEKPRHQVTLSDFSIGETEVTQELWETVMGEKDSYSRGPNYPKCSVSMEDCEVFIGKLISLTGRNFRLPTEAEWEYAAKGGNKSKGFTYSGSNNANDVAWFTGNSGNKIHEVATKSPNELGVYDMSGNAQEWCSDFYDDDYYSSSPLSNPIATYGSGSVYRGGDWNDELKEIRVCNRGGGYYSYGTRGLRLVLTNDNEGIINSPICPDEHHPHMIDLGLPSGIKWACCNVGATSPNNYGGYYCWGEIEEKGEIGWGSYTHSDGRWDNVHYLGDISGTQYDVANVKWGDNWVMPSKENFKELIENCSSKWIRLFGIKGRIFTGLNGLSIFFPANDGFYRIGEYGSYWSSKQIDGYMDAYWGWLVDKAHYLYFDEDESRVYSDGLLQLNGVRPIRLN